MGIGWLPPLPPPPCCPASVTISSTICCSLCICAGPGEVAESISGVGLGPCDRDAMTDLSAELAGSGIALDWLDLWLDVGVGKGLPGGTSWRLDAEGLSSSGLTPVDEPFWVTAIGSISAVTYSKHVHFSGTSPWPLILSSKWTQQRRAHVLCKAKHDEVTVVGMHWKKVNWKSIKWATSWKLKAFKNNGSEALYSSPLTY